MSPDELLAALRDLYDAEPDEAGLFHARNNTEDDHIAADDLVAKTLRSLGYGEAMDIYEHMYAWYA